MNKRQNEILRILLLESNKYIFVNELAEKVECSEKTIRNDFKKIEQYLTEHSGATFIRKPGLGVSLQIDHEDKVNIFNKLNATNQVIEYISDEERVLQIAYLLLMNTKAVPASEIADKFYVNRSIIKKDLDVIGNWLEEYYLVLVSKQKVGLVIEGTEKNRRKALSKLSDLVKNQEVTIEFIEKQFSSYEIDIVKKELKDLQKRCSIYFTDESFEGLLLHTLYMIKRVKLKQPIIIFESERNELKRKEEYKWTVELLKRLEPYFAIRFPEDEVIYLALHILGGKYRFNKKNTAVSRIDFAENNVMLTDLINNLILTMSRLAELDFHKDQILIDGLKVHLYTTLNRLQYGLIVTNPMVNDIKNMYPYMFNMIISALDENDSILPFELPEEEIAYLTLHFQAAIERFEKNNGMVKKAVIVCHMGIGMSQLLRTKIERHFRFIDVMECLAKDDLQSYLENNETDFVISTVELQNVSFPYIVVSPLLSAVEEKKIKEFIKQLDKPKKRVSKQSSFLNYTNPFLVFLQTDISHPNEIIEELASALYKKGYVEEAFISSAVQREEMSATTIGSGIAIPHGSPKYIKESAIAIATLKRPIYWGTERVNLVLMMAVRNNKHEEIKQLFQELSQLSEEPAFIQSLINETDRMKFLNRLNEI